MESRDVIYSTGHFYDKHSGKRLNIKEESDITISIASNNISDSDAVGKLPKKIASSKEQENSIKNKYGISGYKKVFDRGKLLYFSIKRFKSFHEFEIELLEDLFFYLKSNSDDREGKLYKCACIVKSNTTKSIKRFENINACSLNEAYKTTFVHYFIDSGSPSSNAIDRFYEKKGKEDETSIARYRSFN